MRFIYFWAHTREIAEMALEDFYATGEVCDGEHPEIVTRRNRQGLLRYCIEIDG